MNYQLNLKSVERLKALIRAGSFVDRAWTFSVADSNQLLGDPPNWTEYQQWFLGIEVGVPLSPADNGASGQAPQKDWYAYPFGKGDVANLDALRTIARTAEADIAAAATECLAAANQKLADNKMASGAACDLEISFAAEHVKVQASAAGSVIPTFTADAYTGGAMNLDGWKHPVVMDYDGIDVTGKSRPVLRDHDPKLPLGHTTSMGVADGVFKAAGVISSHGDYVDEVVKAAKNNFPWQVSVGAKVNRNEFVPEGKTAQANGKTWSGPINIARATSLREISFLTLGADDDTSARIAATAAKGSKMKKKFAAWAKAHGHSMKDMEDDKVAAAVKSLYKAQMKLEPDDPADADDDGKDDAKADAKAAAGPDAGDIRAAAAGGETISAADKVTQEIRAASVAERKRQASITVKLEEYRSQVPADRFADIEAKAIGGEYDQDKTELELIKARRPERHAPNINTGKGGAPDGAIIAAAAARSAGVGEKMAYKGLNEQQGNIAASLGHQSIHTIIAASAAQMGMHVSPGQINDDFLEEFIRQDKASHRRQISAAAQQNPMIRASTSAGFSTMSLTGITENVMNKVMLEPFTTWPSVIPQIAYERDTNDFKPFKTYRLTATGDLLPVGPGGEIKNMGLQDESYLGGVATKAALAVLKREDIINDDMGALMQMPQIIGRKGFVSREKQVILTIISGLSTTAPGSSVGKTPNGFNFWSTGAKNYLSGANSALNITSLQNAVTMLMQQKDVAGDPVGIMPDRLLVGPENKALAQNLFNGANLTVTALTTPASGAQAATQVVDLNQHKGMYTPIVTPYLGAGSPIQGAQGVPWILLGSPAAGMAPVQIGYLRGQRTPMIKQVDVDAMVLGIAYQVIYDFGVSLLDYRTAVYSAGA